MGKKFILMVLISVLSYSIILGGSITSAYPSDSSSPARTLSSYPTRTVSASPIRPVSPSPERPLSSSPTRSL